MLEYLPRVIAAEEFSPIYVIWERAPAFVRESLELFGVPGSRILSVGESPLTVEEGVIIEPLTGTPGHGRRDLSQFPVLLHELRKRLLMTVPPASPIPGVFISRRSATRGRGLINESKVIEHLKGQGIAPVQMETLSLRDQLSLLQSAGSLYGPHGAGILNALFMQPGSTVVEFLSTLCPTDTNALIMNLMGHTHLQIVSDTPVARFEDPFEIKVEMIP
jgi:capsular polysaccharide biosynthesis protein